MSAFVLDCSTTISWLLPDEASSQHILLLEEVATRGALVPSIWSYEVANALLMAERRGRITLAQRDKVALLQRFNRPSLGPSEGSN